MHTNAILQGVRREWPGGFVRCVADVVEMFLDVEAEAFAVDGVDAGIR